MARGIPVHVDGTGGKPGGEKRESEMQRRANDTKREGRIETAAKSLNGEG